MTQLSINAGFIREELLEGSAGIDLSPEVLQRIDTMDDQVIDEALERVFEDPVHEFNRGLDALVATVREKVIESIRQNAEGARARD